MKNPTQDRVEEVLTLWQKGEVSAPLVDTQFTTDLHKAITSRRNPVFGFEGDAACLPPPRAASPRHVAALRALARKILVVFCLLPLLSLPVMAQEDDISAATTTLTTQIDIPKEKTAESSLPKDKKPYVKVDTTACGGKKYCKDMTSCEEAKMYLTKCNLTRLDKNKDGIPCSSLCQKK